MSDELDDGYGGTLARKCREQMERERVRELAAPSDSAMAAGRGSAALVAIMCPGCKQNPHVNGWQCGGCGHALKETYDSTMPTWAFCPWCGSKLVPPNTKLSDPAGEGH